MFRKISLVLITLLFIGCLGDKVEIDPRGTLTGFVVDTQGKPIEGVEVLISDKKVTSGENGEFKIEDINIGNDPQYNVIFLKDNYIPTSAVAEYNDTITNDNNNGSGSQTSVDEDGAIEVSGMPLENGVVSIKVEMMEIVKIKGKLKLPNGIILASETAIKVVPFIEIAEEYKSVLPKSNYVNEVSDSLNFNIKSLPNFGTYIIDAETKEVSTIIEKISFEIFLNGSDKVSYTIEITDEEALNLKGREKLENIIDLGEFELEKLYEINGSIYTDYNQFSSATKLTVPNSIVVLEKEGTEVSREIADGNGNYKFSGLAAGTYSIKLLNFDSNSDGRTDYIAPEKFDNIVIEKSSRIDVKRNLWYKGQLGYKILGTGYLGILGTEGAKEGITVTLEDENGIIAQTETGLNGEFKFDQVQAETVYISAEDVDTDGNGVYNFLFNEDEKITLHNSKQTTISAIEVFLSVNSQEKNYQLNVKSLNFARKKIDGEFEVISQSLNPTDKLIIEFDKEVSVDSFNRIIEYKEDVITLKNKLTGKSVKTNAKFAKYTDGEGAEQTDYTKLEVTHDFLDGREYSISINERLITKEGFDYEVLNNLNLNVFANMLLEINFEDYELKVVSTTFTNKDELGNFIVTGENEVSDPLDLTFNLPISQSSMDNIKDNGLEFVELLKGEDKVSVYIVVSQDKTLISIDPLEDLEVGVEYTIKVNDMLGSENGYSYGIDMDEWDNEFEVKGIIVKE